MDEPASDSSRRQSGQITVSRALAVDSEHNCRAAPGRRQFLQTRRQSHIGSKL